MVLQYYILFEKNSKLIFWFTFFVLSLWNSGDFYGLIANRVALGLVQGPVFPCLAAFIVPWYPVDQRGKLCSIGYVGISV